MTESFDTILAGGVLVNHDGEGLRDVGLRHGKIAEIGDLSRASAAERVDCTGLHILPGVVDTQVHFREPGATHKEDLETGSRAAVSGRRDGRVRDAEHQAAHDDRGRSRR